MMEIKDVHQQKLLVAEPEEKQEASTDTAKPARLTLKYLNARIQEFEEENRNLTERIHTLDQQFQGFASFQTEAAVDREVLLEETPPSPNGHLSRSTRHPSGKKRSFWDHFFRRQSPLNK
jgi:hypothetical protein